VRATGYVTEAERYGSSFVFHLLLHPRAREAVFGAVAAAPWWLGVEGARWNVPEGPGSDLQERPLRDLGGGPRPTGHPWRLVPVPRLVLQPLPGGRPVEEHPRLLHRARRFPLRLGRGGGVAAPG
jgi:hypothetical protein